jgi:hypothetical protein
MADDVISGENAPLGRILCNKKPENVLRMPGFFPVLFSRTFSHTFFRFPSLFSYYGCSTSRSTSTVVQVAWLPEVTEGGPLGCCAHDPGCMSLDTLSWVYVSKYMIMCV